MRCLAGELPRRATELNQPRQPKGPAALPERTTRPPLPAGSRGLGGTPARAGWPDPKSKAARRRSGAAQPCSTCGSGLPANDGFGASRSRAARRVSRAVRPAGRRRRRAGTNPLPRTAAPAATRSLAKIHGRCVGATQSGAVSRTVSSGHSRTPAGAEGQQGPQDRCEPAVRVASLRALQCTECSPSRCTLTGKPAGHIDAIALEGLTAIPSRFNLVTVCRSPGDDQNRGGSFSPSPQRAHVSPRARGCAPVSAAGWFHRRSRRYRCGLLPSKIAARAPVARHLPRNCCAQRDNCSCPGPVAVLARRPPARLCHPPCLGSLGKYSPQRRRRGRFFVSSISSPASRLFQGRLWVSPDRRSRKAATFRAVPSASSALWRQHGPSGFRSDLFAPVEGELPLFSETPRSGNEKFKLLCIASRNLRGPRQCPPASRTFRASVPAARSTASKVSSTASRYRGTKTCPRRNGCAVRAKLRPWRRPSATFGQRLGRDARREPATARPRHGSRGALARRRSHTPGGSCAATLPAQRSAATRIAGTRCPTWAQVRGVSGAPRSRHPGATRAPRDRSAARNRAPHPSKCAL